jgi:hypothetical protein
MIKELRRHLWRTVTSIIGYAIATHGSVPDLFAERIILIENGQIKN